MARTSCEGSTANGLSSRLPHWGDRFVSESALTSRIRSARLAIGDSGRRQEIIQTVHGRGYRLVAEVT